ncbi:MULTISPECIES: hypothetical protein [unclassified Streptomyces]|nr:MULTISPECIES: hypothetical protein [unclassified Streptomyces]
MNFDQALSAFLYQRPYDSNASRADLCLKKWALDRPHSASGGS